MVSLDIGNLFEENSNQRKQLEIAKKKQKKVID
jgi:hypothetical protein